ncbi:MAG: CDP-alcohol phosphatidyltransferase family protein [Alphaproteobacteria bacterium]
MLNLPNFLTLIRILTIPFFLVYLAYHRYGEAFIVFVLGGMTDFLDGLTARLMNQQTAIGAYLDPAADKLLVISSFVVLGMIGAIPMWLAVVVVSRDVLLIVGYGIVYFLVEERPAAKPSWIGKGSTMLQLVTMGTALALLAKPGLFDDWVMTGLIALTALATIASGVQYIYRGLVWLQNKAPSISRFG